jgi:carbamoyl-phosphate synthase large subunit
MEPIAATVAVTGMNATDNPAPGVAVARALRHEPGFGGRIVGLGYDALDPGFYAGGLLDGGAILPYPSTGRDAYRERLLAVHAELGLDALIPTLDSELRAVAGLERELRAAGIGTFVPSLEAIERASKPRLPQLAAADPRIRVPESEAIVTPEPLGRLIRELGLPIMVKGVYYGAHVAASEADARASFHHFAASWGVPVIVQRFVRGEEYNISAIGDGQGGTVGAVAMRKMALTDKGKGWSGVTVDNRELLALTERVIGALRWRGPLEVEVLAADCGKDYYIVEINPRFPAWIYLSAGAGQNLPYACALLALGREAPRLDPYRVGTLFVRISLDQIADLETFAQLSAAGLLAAAAARGGERRSRAARGAERPTTEAA